MYGECGPANNDAVYNCEYTGEAKPLQNDSTALLLKDVCPHLYTGNTTTTCCDYAQLKRLYDDMSVPRQLMSRCPACFRNFKAFLCDMTCGPNQRDFLLVTGSEPYKNRSQVTKYTYHITNYYTNAMFNSCK